MVRRRDSEIWSVEASHAMLTQQIDDLKELFLQVEGNLEKQVDRRFIASERAVSDRDTAIERRFTTADLFHQTITDAASLAMPRKEAQLLVDALRTETNNSNVNFGSRIDTIQNLLNKLSLQLTALQSGLQGRNTGTDGFRNWMIGIVGAFVGLSSLGLGLWGVLK